MTDVRFPPYKGAPDLREILTNAWALGYRAQMVARASGAFDVLVLDRASAWATARAGELIKGIDATSRERIGSLVAQVESGDLSEDDLPDAVSGVLGGISGWRADMIARTEMSYAANAGSVQGFRDTGAEAVAIHDGTDFDEECIDADGATWSLDYYESNTLEHPNCGRSADPLYAGQYDPSEVEDG